MDFIQIKYLHKMFDKSILFVFIVCASFYSFKTWAQLDSLLNQKNINTIHDQHIVETTEDDPIKWKKYREVNYFSALPKVQQQIALHMFGDSVAPEEVYIGVSHLFIRKGHSKTNTSDQNLSNLIFTVKIITPEFNYWANLKADIDSNLLNINKKLPHHSQLKFSLTDFCNQLEEQLLDTIHINEYHLDFRSKQPELIYVWKCNRFDTMIIENRRKTRGYFIEKYTLIKMHSYSGLIEITNETDTTRFSNLNVNF